MPRKNPDAGRYTYKFNRDQRDSMARHVAGVFTVFYKDGSTIRIDARSDEARTLQLIALLSKRAHPVGGMKRGSNAHNALVAQVTRRLIAEQQIHFEHGEAVMAKAARERLQGKSRSIRDAKRAQRPQHYTNRKAPQHRVRAV